MLERRSDCGMGGEFAPWFVTRPTLLMGTAKSNAAEAAATVSGAFWKDSVRLAVTAGGAFWEAQPPHPALSMGTSALDGQQSWEAIAVGCERMAPPQ